MPRPRRPSPARHQARAQGGRAGGRLPGRRRKEQPPPVDPRAPGASPGPFHVRSRDWPRPWSSRHVGQPWRPWATVVAGGVGGDRDFSRNSAACTRLGGADFQERGTRVWVPPVRPSRVHEARSVGRVPRSAQHASVGGVERRAAIDECQNMVERQVTRRMGWMLGTIARADVAVLADVARDHPLGQASPSCIRMDVMVGTDARQARMLTAASSRSARDHTADRAQLHWSP